MKRLIVTILLTLSMITVWGFLGYAHGNGINGCYQKKNGQLRIVANPNIASQVKRQFRGMYLDTQKRLQLLAPFYLTILNIYLFNVMGMTMLLVAPIHSMLTVNLCQTITF